MRTSRLRPHVAGARLASQSFLADCSIVAASHQVRPNGSYTVAPRTPCCRLSEGTSYCPQTAKAVTSKLLPAENCFVTSTPTNQPVGVLPGDDGAGESWMITN
jgi:hypothetical protein